jgi:hypothetical protein
MAMNLRVTQKATNCLTAWITLSFSRMYLLHKLVNLYSVLGIANCTQIYVWCDVCVWCVCCVGVCGVCCVCVCGVCVWCVCMCMCVCVCAVCVWVCVVCVCVCAVCVLCVCGVCVCVLYVCCVCVCVVCVCVVCVCVCPTTHLFIFTFFYTHSGRLRISANFLSTSCTSPLCVVCKNSFINTRDHCTVCHRKSTSLPLNI